MANLILPCGVTGDPTPTVTWYRGDTVLPSQSVTSDGSLVMNVTEGVDASRDGVLYHCEASNVFGSNGSPAVLRSRDVNVTYTCEIIKMGGRKEVGILVFSWRGGEGEISFTPHSAKVSRFLQ